MLLGICSVLHTVVSSLAISAPDASAAFGCTLGQKRLVTLTLVPGGSGRGATDDLRQPAPHGYQDLHPAWLRGVVRQRDASTAERQQTAGDRDQLQAGGQAAALRHSN